MRTDEGVQVDRDVPELRLRLWTSGRVPPRKPPQPQPETADLGSAEFTPPPAAWRRDAAIAVETAPPGDRN